MTYTINGWQYSELGINKRCAELMGFEVLDEKALASKQHENFRQDTLNNCWIVPVTKVKSYNNSARYSPCTWIADTDAIIDKCFDELNESILRNGGRRKSHWQDTMKTHNCTKLVAACICYIEINEAA
jgi:hypothetical protein